MLSQKVERAAVYQSDLAGELVEAQKQYEAKLTSMTKRVRELEERRLLETSALDSSTMELGATIDDLTTRLKKSEEANTNLQTYIDHLKKSYQTVFGAEHASQSSPSSLSVSQSQNQ